MKGGSELLPSGVGDVSYIITSFLLPLPGSLPPSGEIRAFGLRSSSPDYFCFILDSDDSPHTDHLSSAGLSTLLTHQSQPGLCHVLELPVPLLKFEA